MFTSPDTHNILKRSLSASKREGVIIFLRLKPKLFVYPQKPTYFYLLTISSLKDVKNMLTMETLISHATLEPKPDWDGTKTEQRKQAVHCFHPLL